MDEIWVEKYFTNINRFNFNVVSGPKLQVEFSLIK